MEQIGTPPLLTPISTLLNSYLDFSSIDSPDTSSGGDANVFSHAFEQHFNARQKPSACNSSDDSVDISLLASTELLEEDYFVTDIKNYGSGSMSSNDSQLRSTLGPSKESHSFPYPGSLLSPNSMAIIERNKMEHWQFPQETEWAHHSGLPDSKAPASMKDYPSYIAEYTRTEIPTEDKVISKASGKQGRQTKKKVADEKSRSEKRSQILERNRIAAGKCRKRKKANISTLEERCHILKARNTAMKELAYQLMSEVEGLKVAAQQHQTENCAVNNDDGGSEGDERSKSKTSEVNVKLEDKTQTSVGSDTQAG